MNPDNPTRTRLFNLAEKSQTIFKYNAGKNDLLADILKAGNYSTPQDLHEYMLRQVIRQPTALFCGNINSPETCCCFVHIVNKTPMTEWEKSCKKLDANLHARLTAIISETDLNPEQVLACIQAECGSSTEWKDAFGWLSIALPYVCTAAADLNPPIRHKIVADEVMSAAKVFIEWKNYPLRPCQLAAILLNVYGVKTKTKLLIEMKTGEGKTNVCGVSAAVVAKLYPQGPALILTSSSDRAKADKEAMTKFIENYLKITPNFVEELKPDSTVNTPRVAYGHVSDVQRIVVDMLTKYNPAGLYSFLKTCSFFLDEADHVLIEQAESLLYIASPCPSYYALHSLFFQIQYRIDYHGDFIPDKVKTRAAIQERAQKLTEVLLQHVRDYEAANKDKGALHPAIIDLNVFVAASASGAMSARFKINGKQYIIEVTSETEHSGSIGGVQKITIVDIATGIESAGTRWTTEAPFIEAMEGLPIGGSDPLAFYSSFPYILQQVRWFGGITGTIGAEHTLKYFAETFDVQSTFRIPRTKPATIYRLPTNITLTEDEDEQMKNIYTAIRNWMAETTGVQAKGPVLVIAESIQKAQRIVNELTKHVHAEMETKVEIVKGDDGKDVEKVTWKFKDLSAVDDSAPLHVFPFFFERHRVMHEFPDWVVVVASNKGGRGLDLKLDHDKCPPLTDGSQCTLHHHKSELKTGMKSVLFVILTDVLPGRQDEQAIGRCGRCGKAGVVQYQLLRKEEDSKPIDPEIVYLERKSHKDALEEYDFNSKCNRIAEHRHDGFVLDKFCENLPVYVNEWMLKLFPAQKSSTKKNDVDGDSNTSGESGAASDHLNTGDSLDILEPVVRGWFTEYLAQMWAYWRSFGSTRRQAGDFYCHFKYRMGLVTPVDLPESEDPNPLQCFAIRFWRFACVLRLSGEVLYTFAKALLASENELQVMGLCLDILNRASSPTNKAGGVPLTLLPNGSDWQGEYSGNAALLFARLSKDPCEGLRRAIECLDVNIARYTNFDEMSKKVSPETLSPLPQNRNADTYYHVQRVEIVRQLRERQNSLNALLRQPQRPLALKHISEGLKNPDIAYHAYCLGYGFCEVMFEWYIDTPFVKAADAVTKWGNLLMVEATKLGAPARSSSNGGNGSGATEHKTDAQLGKLEKEGAAILTRLESETLKATNGENNKNGSAPVYQWKPSAPTKDDIKASQQATWSIGFGWLLFVWAWIVSVFTAPVRRYSVQNQRQSQQSNEQARNDSPIWAYLHSQMRKLASQQAVITSGLVNEYLGDKAKAIIDIVDELGPLQRQTDLVQENVKILTNGETPDEINRSEAKKQADKEAADQVHLRDDKLSKEDMYLISKALEALKTVASEQKLEGFDDQLMKMLEAIAQYNEFAQEGKVDSAIAKRMNDAMKALWQDVLRFALDHGTKIEELKRALENYNIAKNQSEFTTQAKKVVEKVTEFNKKVVNVVKDVVEWVWGWLGWLWGKVKKIVKEVVQVVQEIPVVRDVVAWVDEQVINPVYAAAKNFFNSAKVTLANVVKRMATTVSSAFNSIVQAISSAANTLWEKASKAWDWLKETSFWKILSEKLTSAFNWVAEKLTWVFVNVVMPALTWIGNALSWAWSVLKPILDAIASFGMLCISKIVQLWKFIYTYLRYWWQGAGDILQDFIWGSEFDIIDVSQNPNRVTRFRMRLRAALRRVWASSWLQWLLDKSIRLGLHIDRREHVQERQSIAHSDFQRREHLAQQQKGMTFAVIGVVLAALIVVGVVFSGGALLLPVIGLICASLSARLQYASMDLEAYMSIDQERKQEIQNMISIAQSVILIVSLVFGLVFGAGSVLTELETMVGTAARYAQMAFQKVSAWLQSIADTLRIEQRAKSALQGIDKILRMFGIGGAGAVLMAVHDSLLGMMNTMLDSVGNFMQFGTMLFQTAKRKIQNMMEQNEQQTEQNQNEDDEDNDTSDKQPHSLVGENISKRDRVRKDGWTLQQIVMLLSATAHNESSSSGRGAQGSAPTYCFTPPNRGEPINITYETNTENGELEVKLSRELSVEERALFGFGDGIPSVAQIQKLFQSGGGVEVVSDTTVRSKNVGYFNKDGQELKREQHLATEAGELTAVHRKGKRILTVQPNGDPKPAPLILDLQSGGNLSERIRGEITEKHLELLAQFLGSDKTAMDEFAQNDLQELVNLAKANHEQAKAKKETNETTKKEQRDFSSTIQSTTSNAARKAAESTWQWAKHALVALISPLLNSITQSPVFAPAKLVWSWISKTSFGQWVIEKVTEIRDFVQTAAEKTWTFFKGVIPPSIGRWIGLQSENALTEPVPVVLEGEEAPTAVPAELTVVDRFFEALLSKQVSEEKQSLEQKFLTGILDAFKMHSVKGADFDKAAELLLGRFLGETNRKLSAQEKQQLQSIQQLDTAKKVQAIFNWLCNIATQKLSNRLTPTSAPKSKGAALYEQMVSSNADYSRRNLQFLAPPVFNREHVANAVQQLAEKLGVPNGIQQTLPSKTIQSHLEKFVREGDQQGLVDYVQKFLNSPMPEEFAQIPGMDEKWKRAREEEARNITEKLLALEDHGWSQVTDATVASSTYELVELMSKSVGNLWIQNLAEVSTEAVVNDQANFSDREKGESADNILKKDGKLKLEINRAAMGEQHESYVKKELEKTGHEVLDAKLPGNTGIDILAVKRDENGNVVDVLVVECKATGQDSVNKPKLSNTKAGKQLESSWIAEKMRKMYEQGGALREAAILMRKNLDKVKTMIAFEKHGENSWAHQDRVPEFDAALVEELLKKYNWIF